MFSGAIVIYAIGRLPVPQHIIGLGMAGAALLALALSGAWWPTSTARHGRLLLSACLVLSGMIAGIVWTASHAQQRLDDRFPRALEKQPIWVSGYACSVPALGSWSSVRQDFCVTRWHLPDSADLDPSALPVPAKLRLARYKAEDRFALGGPATVEVSLKRPHGNVNPDGFRYETWLFRQGYVATGTLREIGVSGSEAQLECGPACRYHQLRQGLVQALSEQVGDMRHLALVESLWLGSRGLLQPEDWEVLRATGTSHLVAISGLHVGLIAAMVGLVAHWLLIRLLGDRFGPRLVPAVTYALVCLSASAYALLAGFTVPTQRALVMVIIAGAVLLRGRVRRAWDAWLLALLLVLLLDPFAILDMGFWLSFGAVACLVLAFSGSLATPGGWRGLVIAQVAITFGLWPILSLLGIEPAPLGLPANLFAIPWLSLVVMPVLMVAVPVILMGGVVGSWATALVDAVLGIMWWVLVQIAGQEGWPGLSPVPLTLLLLAAVIGLLVLLPVGRTYRGLALVLGAAVALNIVTETRENSPVAEPELTVFDVGQGLSVLLRDGSQAMLYDTGPAGGGFSTAESQVLPSAAVGGVRQLDLLVLSHGDGDHAGAWQTVVKRLAPGEIISGEPEALAPGVSGCEAADGWRIGRWRLQAWQSARAGSSNARSCVIEAVYDRYRVALTGDIGLAEEAAWLEARDGAGVDVLLAPHHGSRSSSGTALVSALAPAYVVFSAGYLNPYGHPHDDVVGRYLGQGATVLSTAGMGALTFTFSDKIFYQAQRDRSPFWIKPSAPL